MPPQGGCTKSRTSGQTTHPPLTALPVVVASWVWGTRLAKWLHKGLTARRLCFVGWVELRSSRFRQPRPLCLACFSTARAPRPRCAAGCRLHFRLQQALRGCACASINCTFLALEMMCRLPSVPRGPLCQIDGKKPSDVATLQGAEGLVGG